MNQFEKHTIEELTINTLRTLSMDRCKRRTRDIRHANGAGALAYVLWKKFLRYNPKNPQWFNRDRFVMSNGHASPCNTRSCI